MYVAIYFISLLAVLLFFFWATSSFTCLICWLCCLIKWDTLIGRVSNECSRYGFYIDNLWVFSYGRWFPCHCSKVELWLLLFKQTNRPYLKSFPIFKFQQGILQPKWKVCGINTPLTLILWWLQFARCKLSIDIRVIKGKSHLKFSAIF